jgi:hypothetical protein
VFVAVMEDVLSMYVQPDDENCQVVCMDEKLYQLFYHEQDLLPVKPEHTEKVDNEYRRNGTCSIFIRRFRLNGDWAHVQIPQTE